MNYDEIQNEIDELEEAIAECDFGSSSYDFLNAEIEHLYLKRDRLKKDKK
jgi:redox-regulated HSP33 family molecular chaperone